MIRNRDEGPEPDFANISFGDFIRSMLDVSNQHGEHATRMMMLLRAVPEGQEVPEGRPQWYRVDFLSILLEAEPLTEHEAEELQRLAAAGIDSGRAN